MSLLPSNEEPISSALIHRLRRVTPRGNVAMNVPTSTLTRWQIGGPAAVVVEPGDYEELSAALITIEAEQAPLCVVGDGSNLLFDTQGFNGVILRLGEAFSSIRINDTTITAGAATSVPTLARAAGHAGLTGIEHIVGIPGSLGGLVLMNGGSMRKGIGTHVTAVRCINSRGELLELSHDNCQFAYRSSRLQTLHAVVVEVDLVLEPGDPSTINTEMDRIIADRAAKFPLDLPNCGSTFVSDPALYETIGPPGRAIEAVGLKGTRRGNVQISPQHANFFVNLGGGNSDDALWLIALARNRVREATGIAMECEVRYVSPDGQIKPASDEAERRWGQDPLSPA